MDEILLCTSDPLLRKALYALLRNLGFWVVTTEQTAAAVQMALAKRYKGVILDGESVGLRAGDGARILERENAAANVVVIGEGDVPSGALTFARPLDLEEFSYVMSRFCVSNNIERRLGEA